jgi:hypothetical protein
MRIRIVAALQLALLFPAAFFMVSLVVRNLGTLEFEPAPAAHQIVMWYAGRLWTLWAFLFGMPCLVLVSGCAALRGAGPDVEQLGDRRALPAIRPHWLLRLVSATTVTSAGILVVVVLHVLTH